MIIGESVESLVVNTIGPEVNGVMWGITKKLINNDVRKFAFNGSLRPIFQSTSTLI